MEGRFKNGVLHGNGIQKFKFKRSLYRGYFVDGEKHGKGEEVYQNCNESLTNTYNGFFLNGGRSCVGTLDYYDSGFEPDEKKIERLQIRAPWLAGQPKAGGEITKINSNIFVPTTNKPLSKYNWLYKFKKIEERKEKKYKENSARELDASLQFRILVQQKKKKIFETHRNFVMNILTGENENSKLAKQSFNTIGRKHNGNTLKLPFKSKYYNQQTINLTPKSLEEAKERSGFRSKICLPKYKIQATYHSIIESLESKWLEMGINLEQLPIVKHVYNEYYLIGEKWTMVNVKQIREESL